MKSRQSNNSEKGQKNIDRTFYSLTRHLRAKDFRWIKEDLEIQDSHGTGDLQVSNDNQNPTRN